MPFCSCTITLELAAATVVLEAVKINTVCWATLLGHVTGFAAINAWGTLQQANHCPCQATQSTTALGTDVKRFLAD